MNYIIFCKPSCPYCTDAVELLEDSDKEYKIVNFDKDQEQVLQDIKLALEWPTVPMVFRRQENILEFIGGYTDLAEHLKDG